jgi:L,D-transpeptidase catalytic domain
MRKILVFITAVALCVQPLTVAAEEVVVVPSKLEVEVALAKLGLPVGIVDGEYDDKTFRATCAWRLISGEVAVFGKPLKRERASIVETTAFAKPQLLSVGLHVNLTCQTLTWIDRTKTDDRRRVKAVFPVSSGMSNFETPQGRFEIYRQFDGWWESTIYQDAWMYRPKYFAPSVALHGSATDALVKTYPASHGCVRMLHRHTDRLWKNDIGVGYRVIVKGSWVTE